MLWTRFEPGSWTVGVEIDLMYTLHIGSLKLSWVPRGSKLYYDFKRIRRFDRR